MNGSMRSFSYISPRVFRILAKHYLMKLFAIPILLIYYYYHYYYLIIINIGHQNIVV